MSKIKTIRQWLIVSLTTGFLVWFVFALSAKVSVPIALIFLFIIGMGL